MTSGIKAQMGQVMGGMVKYAEKNPAITSCALAALGSILLCIAMSGSLPAMATSITTGMVMTGGLLYAGRHYVFKHYKEEEWVKKARKTLRIALPVIFSAAFIAVAVGITVHGIQAGQSSSLSMQEFVPLLVGSGMGALSIYAAGHLLLQGQEKKRWYRALRSTAAVGGAILMPLGYAAICAVMLSGGPTTMLFYAGLIATGLLPDVLSESRRRLLKS